MSSDKSKRRSLNSKAQNGVTKHHSENPTNFSETQPNNDSMDMNARPQHDQKEEKEEEEEEDKDHQTQETQQTEEKKSEFSLRFQVHVCRFFEWVPAAIISLAYNKSSNLLAAGKANGDIEIWNTRGRWFIDRVIKSLDGVPAKSIAWSKDRLFSAALSGQIIEWDLNCFQEKNVEDSYGGAVWDIGVNAAGTLLAAACDDGCVRLYDIENGLRFYKSFHMQKEKTLCLAWHPDGNDIFTGGSLGVIRRFDVKTGSNTFYTKLPKLQSKPAVWTIKCMNDFTVVAGDSNGYTHFLDGQFCVINHSYKQHQADVLCLTVDETNAVVYSSGVDSQVAAFQRLTENSTTKWIPTVSQRMNHLDTRALVMIGKWVVSGGNENRLVLYSTESFDNLSTSKKFSPYPFKPVITGTGTRKHRLLLCRHDRKLELWTLGKADKEEHESVASMPSGASLKLSKDARFLLALTPKLGNLVCSALSADGSFVACSDRKSLKLYHIEGNIVQKLTLPAGLGPAHEVLFTPDSTKLIIGTPTAEIQIYDITNAEIIATFTEHQQLAEKKGIPAAAISTLAVHHSRFGDYLASGDLNNFINTYDLQTLKYLSTLPVFDSRQVALDFHPQKPMMVILCGSKHFYLYDVAAKTMNPWSRKNAAFFSEEYFSDKSSSIAIKFDPVKPDILLLYSDVVFHCISLKQQFVKSCRKYRGIMHMNFLYNEDMVVVERTWRDVMSSLPEPLFRVRYGT